MANNNIGPVVPKFKVKIKDAGGATLGFLGKNSANWCWIVVNANALWFSEACDGDRKVWMALDDGQFLSVSNAVGQEGWVGLSSNAADGATWTLQADGKLEYAWGGWTPEKLSKGTTDDRVVVGTDFGRSHVFVEIIMASVD